MKTVFTLLLLMATAELVHGQTDDIKVENIVRFTTFEDYITKEVTPSIQFEIKVINNSKKPIPDLGVTNRSEYVNFYINGKQSNPVSLYNGMEVTDSDKTIPVGDSATYYVSWVLSADSGIITHYGNEFTVHWQYMEHYTDILQVNIEKKTAR